MRRRGSWGSHGATENDPRRDETVDRGDDDAKPDRRSRVDRARNSDTIVAVDTREQVTRVYQKTEKNTTSTDATTTQIQTPTETIDDVDHENN